MPLVVAQKFHNDLCKIFMQDKRLRGSDSLRTMVTSSYQACKVLWCEYEILKSIPIIALHGRKLIVFIAYNEM